MKDLKKLAAECEQDLLSIGIQPGQINRWIVNTRAKRWGYCEKYLPGIFNISISAGLLDDDVNDQVVKDTIVHELLHTIKGCMSHGQQWQMLAAKVNYRLPQYRIKQTTSESEKGVYLRTNRYAIQCQKCGKESYREKKSTVIRYPERYRCRACGGKLVRIR